MSVIEILTWPTVLWVLMLVVDGFYDITKPKVDHPYKYVGALVMTFSAVGWFWLAVAHLMVYMGVVITWG